MRWLLASICFAAVAAFVAADPPDLGTRKSGSDWPRFLGPTGDSVSTEKGLISPWPKGGLRLVWQCPLGSGYAPPTVSRGRLFHFDRFGDKARLTCRNSETGAELWRFEYPTDYEDYFGYDNGPRCSPIVDGDRVYLYGSEGMVHCVRAADGKPLWKVDTRSEFHVFQNFFGVSSCPLIEGDLVLVGVGGSPNEQPPDNFLDLKSNGSAIVAFDKLTGKVRFRCGQDLASNSTPVVATIDGIRRGLYLARGGLLGFDPKTGRVDFHYPWRARLLESVNASNPVVVGDRVLLTECYGIGSTLLKIKAGSVEEMWADAKKGRDKSLMCHWNTPIYHDGHVYGCSGRHTAQAELRCVELATGKVKWRQPGLTRSSLLMADGHFICLCEDGLLILLKVTAQKFDEVSRIDLSEHKPALAYPCWAAPVLSHGLLYVRGKDRLLCFEAISNR